MAYFLQDIDGNMMTTNSDGTCMVIFKMTYEDEEHIYLNPFRKSNVPM